MHYRFGQSCDDSDAVAEIPEEAVNAIRPALYDRDHFAMDRFVKVCDENGLSGLVREQGDKPLMKRTEESAAP